MTQERHVYDCVVIGGGPAGATAAHDLARAGYDVALLDRAGRIKPCGGAIPPRLMRDFDIPDDILVAKIAAARIVAPSGRYADMAIRGGFVGMVDRKDYDEWLRNRAMLAGAERVTGVFDRIERDASGHAIVHFRPPESRRDSATACLKARTVIGADGAKSKVASQEIPGGGETPCVFAYHEILDAPTADFDGTRCDVYYQSPVSPDFYGWVFPHGRTVSVGVGSAHKGFGLRPATALLRERAGLSGSATVRCEGAPIPLKPLKRWDNGRDVVLAGDAAGVVAPASGEGIYYAMTGGRLAAQAVEKRLISSDARALAGARKAFMKAHGQVFFMLGMMQRYWYSSDSRRERFVRICHDVDVQRLTWDAYMNKELVRGDHLTHMRIFFKNIAHLSGLAPA